MSSISFDFQSLQGATVVPIALPGPGLEAAVQEQGQSTATAEASIAENVGQRDGSKRFCDAYAFLRLLDSYEKLCRHYGDSDVVHSSIVRHELEGLYEALENIAQEYPEMQSKLPPNPHGPILR